MTRLTDKVRMLFDGKNFAVLSTLEPDGRPHSTVTWVKRDADDVLFALPKSRRKTANLIRDPRAAVVIFDAASPYESAQIQGTASIEDDPDGMLVDELSHKYTGGPYPGFAGPNPQWVPRMPVDRAGRPARRLLFGPRIPAKAANRHARAGHAPGREHR
jgi:PPOX class probable F420-dependent enzyme